MLAKTKYELEICENEDNYICSIMSCNFNCNCRDLTCLCLMINVSQLVSASKLKDQRQWGFATTDTDIALTHSWHAMTCH